MKKIITLSFFLLIINLNVLANNNKEGFTINYTPENPIRIIGSFYTDPMASPTSIESVKSWNNFLYLAVRYGNGDQKLEVWDVRDPAHPQLSESISYGNLYAQPRSHWLFPYVNVFDDAIIVRSNFMETIYHHGPDGKLVSDGIHDFAQSAGELINNEESLFMSSAGTYGTFFGRLFNPYEVLPEEEYGYAVLDFTNPRHPFIASIVPSSTEIWTPVSFAGHLNASFGNNPSNININGNQIRIKGREILADSHLDVFWEPRFSQIFDLDTFNRTLRDQVELLITQTSINELFIDAIDRFFDDLEIEIDRTLGQAILQGYQNTDRLKTLLDDYNINREDSIRIAIQKVIKAHLDADLEMELSSALFAPLINDWLEGLLEIPFDQISDITETITSILNEGLDEETVARYLLDNYISPYTDTPEWMHWTMDEVVDRVCDTPAAEVISTAIGGVESIVNAGDFLETALEFVPPAKRFYLPAGFPEDCRDILEYALFEHGAGLKRKGLAFMELLKFYQYYNRNENYLNYEKEFAEAIQSLQGELAGAVTETLEPFTSSFAYLGDMADRINQFTSTIPCRDFLTSALTDAIMVRIETAGLSIDQPIGEVLLQYDLYLSLNDTFGLREDDLANIEDFLYVLENELTFSQIQIRQLWNEGASHIDHFEKACRTALLEMIREAWGDIDVDLPVHQAIREFLKNHIDFRWTFGANMDSLLKDFVYSALTEYPGFVDAIGIWERAEKGDVIARWQATFQAAKVAAAALDWTGTLPITYETIELTLEETYRQAMAAAVKMLLMDFVHIISSDMFGSFSHWGSATTDFSFSFDANELSDALNPVASAAFVWEDIVGVLPRENWDFLHPRRMSLILLDPANPLETKYETVFPNKWGNVDYVHHADGMVMVGGSRYEGIIPISTALFMMLDDQEINAHYIDDYRLSSAEGILTVNHGFHIVAYGPGGIFLLNNPMHLKPGKVEPISSVRNWENY